MIPVHETILENGLKVLVQEVRTAPVVAFMVWYRVGSRNENVGITGISHLLEHMMFKGTPQHGKGVIARTLQRAGASFNASTSLDFTNYHEVLASDRLELAMRLEADRMANALIPEEEHRLEMTVVRSELEHHDDNPRSQLYQETFAHAFHAHPYHWPTIGWRADVEGIRTEQIRAYYRTHYAPNNAFVVIVGDVDTKEALALVRKHFGPIPRGADPPPVRVDEPEQRGERRFKVRRPGDTPYLMVSWKTPVLRDPDTCALDALGMILGHGKTSRLHQALVEGQLATQADAGNETLRDPFLLIAQATVAPGVALARVEEALLREADRLREGPPAEAELARAKKQLQATFVYARDSIRSLANQLGYYEIVDSWRYLTTYLDEVTKLTPADVQRVAAKYLAEDRRVVGWYEPVPRGEGAAAPGAGGGQGGDGPDANGPDDGEADDAGE
jgi:zinc protease